MSPARKEGGQKTGERSMKKKSGKRKDGKKKNGNSCGKTPSVTTAEIPAKSRTTRRTQHTEPRITSTSQTPFPHVRPVTGEGTTGGINVRCAGNCGRKVKEAPVIPVSMKLNDVVPGKLSDSEMRHGLIKVREFIEKATPKKLSETAHGWCCDLHKPKACQMIKKNELAAVSPGSCWPCCRLVRY